MTTRRAESPPCVLNLQIEIYPGWACCLRCLVQLLLEIGKFAVRVLDEIPDLVIVPDNVA